MDKRRRINRWWMILALGMLPLSSLGQQAIDWDLLAKVTFSYDYLSNIKTLYAKPDFSPEVLALDSAWVSIEGYVMPMDTEGEKYALSAEPYQACFFCGNAGPESVMELHFKSKRPPRYDIDAYIKFDGRLVLNKEDPMKLTYSLTEAVSKSK